MEATQAVRTPQIPIKSRLQKALQTPLFIAFSANHLFGAVKSRKLQLKCFMFARSVGTSFSKVLFVPAVF